MRRRKMRIVDKGDKSCSNEGAWEEVTVARESRLMWREVIRVIEEK